MSRHPTTFRSAVPAGQASRWPLEADASSAPASPAACPAASQEAATPDVVAAGTRRRRTPSFVCELPLRVGPAQERVLQVRLEAARALYNASLGEARTRWRLVRQSNAYQYARTLPRHTPERTAAFTAARAAHGFTDAALQTYAKDCRHASRWIEEHLDAPVCQKLATRAYRAVLCMAVGKAKRVRFKGKQQLDTVEGKSNETGLVWRSDRVVWRGLTLPASLPQRVRRDPVLAHGLAAPVKYVRLVRRRIGERTRFWVQLICEGTPYQKPKHTLGEGVVGLDLGPSTLAVVSATEGETGTVLCTAGSAGGPDPAGAAAPGSATTGQQPRQLPAQRLGQERLHGQATLAGVGATATDPGAAGRSAAQADSAP